MQGAEGLLLHRLSPSSLRALRATSKQLRQQIRESDFSSSLQLTNSQDLHSLLKYTWPSLTQLTFMKAYVGWEDMAVLAESHMVALPALTHLSISCRTIKPNAVQELAFGTLSSLRSLGLSCALSWTPIWEMRRHLLRQALIASGCRVACRYLARNSWPQLTSVNLSGTDITAAAMAELAKGQWPALRSLDVSATQRCLEDSFVPELAKGPWTALQHLTLGNVCLGVGAAQRLQSAHLPHWTELDLSHSLALPSSVFVQQGVGLGKFRPVRPIDMVDGELEKEECVAKCRHIAAGKWLQLANLNLGLNQLTAGAMTELAKGNWPALQKLDLSANNQLPASAGFVEQLALSAWTALQELDLRNTGAWSADMQWLQRAMWPQLTCMDFRGRHLYTFEGASEFEAFSKAWQGSQPHWPLVHLRLGYRGLCIPEVEQLSPLLVGWCSLKHLHLGESMLRPEQIECLLQACGPTLDTLRVECHVRAATEYKPEMGSWPCNTMLHLLGELDEAVLQSLSLGYWLLSNSPYSISRTTIRVCVRLTKCWGWI